MHKEMPVGTFLQHRFGTSCKHEFIDEKAGAVFIVPRCDVNDLWHLRWLQCFCGWQDQAHAHSTIQLNNIAKLHGMLRLNQFTDVTQAMVCRTENGFIQVCLTGVFSHQVNSLQEIMKDIFGDRQAEPFLIHFPASFYHLLYCEMVFIQLHILEPQPESDTTQIGGDSS